MTAECRTDLLSGLVHRFLNVTNIGTTSGVNRKRLEEPELRATAMCRSQVPYSSPFSPLLLYTFLCLLPCMGHWLPIPSHLPAFTMQDSSPPSNPRMSYFILFVVALQPALVVAQAGESRSSAPQFIGISCPLLAWLDTRCVPRTGMQLLKVACAPQMLVYGRLPCFWDSCYGLEV